MLLALPQADADSPRPTLCVVAPAEWRPALAPFVAERSKELVVELVALEDVLASEPGAAAIDPPERIKRFLHRGWKERGVRYALLVGDADTFPVRFMVLDRVTPTAFDYAFYPSDLYYADVADAAGAFDAWNAATEGFHAAYFGEVRGEKNKDGPINHDRVSYVPELAVGRWPVSDATALDAVVKKTLAHVVPKVPHALLVHAEGWVDERERVRGMASKLAAGGFAVEPQIYGDPARAPTVEHVVAGMRGGRELVLHFGHGSPDGWEGCLGPLEPFADVTPAVFLSAGCSTARLCCEPPYDPYVDIGLVRHAGTNAGETFTSPPPPPACLQPGALDRTSVGERMLRMPRGGAVVYIGCDTGAQPCAVTLLEGFVLAVAERRAERAGDAWRLALEHYWKAERLAELVPDDGWYPPSVFFQGMKFLYFGDPTLRLAGPR